MQQSQVFAKASGFDLRTLYRHESRGIEIMLHEIDDLVQNLHEEDLKWHREAFYGRYLPATVQELKEIAIDRAIEIERLNDLLARRSG